MSGARTTALHSAAWEPAAPRYRRGTRTATGLRVFAVLVGVAVVTSRSSHRR
jgi:hypothetical protein